MFPGSKFTSKGFWAGGKQGLLTRMPLAHGCQAAQQTRWGQSETWVVLQTLQTRLTPRRQRTSRVQMSWGMEGPVGGLALLSAGRAEETTSTPHRAPGLS